MPYSTMIKIPNKLVIFGVVAAATVFMTGMVSTLGLQESYAVRDNENKCNNNAQGVNIAVCANVPVCAQVAVIAEDNLNQCD